MKARVKNIDLNCDMGEGMTTDASIMPFISSANIACGYHAGDVDTMKRTIALCLQHKVAIGAHPGFNDKENFGRINQQLSDQELYDLVAEQLLIIQQLCKVAGTTLHHVKPHGALYNMAAKNQHMSTILAKAVYEFDPSLFYYGLSNSFMITEAKNLGLKTVNEVFADRTYQVNGSLTPRTEKNALIEDTEIALAQVLQMVQSNTVKTIQGKEISLQPQTICLHGDGPHAVDFAKVIYQKLKNNSIHIQAPVQ
jgi:UPF0271 protein